MESNKEAVKRKHMALLGIMLTILAAGISLLATNYGPLPDRIPTHFGLTGEPDSWDSKTTLLIFPGLQGLFLAIALVIYRYPNYVNIPSTIALKHLPGEIRERAYEMIRDVVFITIVIVSFLMLYLTNETLKVATGLAMSINLWGVLGILSCLAPPIVYYAIKMRRLS